jgi:hypothetical protein
MKFEFNSTTTGDEKHSITAELSEDGQIVIIECATELFTEDKSFNSHQYILSKKQLRDFIGALLHFQTKIKA